MMRRLIFGLAVMGGTVWAQSAVSQSWRDYQADLVAQGVLGLPVADASLEDARQEALRHRAWLMLGVQITVVDYTALVSSLAPDGAAREAGLQAGDVVKYIEVAGIPMSAGPFPYAFMERMEGQEGPVKVYFTRAGTTWQQEALVYPREGGSGDVPPLPQALQQVANDPAMMAIWRHEASAVDTAERADAAIRILFALSHHVAGCAGPDAVALPITTTVTTETTDGLGTYRGREVETFQQVLQVRPVFEPLARQVVGYFSDNVLNRRFVAVRDLISDEGCAGPNVRHLEEGLARAAGVQLN